MVVTLKHLTLENYGPFTKLDIDLSDITIFVGRNNTGKSTALEAITLLLSSFNETDFSEIISRLSEKADYLINLRSDRDIAFVKGNIVGQGVSNNVELRIMRGVDKFGEKRDEVLQSIKESFTELSPRSRDILKTAYNRIVEKEVKEGGKIIHSNFDDFINDASAMLNDLLDDLLAIAIFIGTYINGELYRVALLSNVEDVVKNSIEPVIKRKQSIIIKKSLKLLERLKLNEIELITLLSSQLDKVRSLDYGVISEVNISPIHARSLSLSSFSIDDLPPYQQSELVEMLRNEVNYFYDYRDGQVILNFDNGKVSVPYDLMGDGFKALVEMLSIIVSGVNVAIIDEPENHLHPGFMEVITRYIVEPKFLNKVQFIMATQSLEFLDYLLNAARERNVLDRVRFVRLYLLPNGDIDYEQLSGDEAYEERNELKWDLRGP